MLFLDDLQWADLALAQARRAAPRRSLGSGDLLIIGAYRDNEVQSAHPLRSTQRAVAKMGARVSEILLRPLDERDVGALVADALHCDPARCRPARPAVLRAHRRATRSSWASSCARSTTIGLIAFDPGAGAWSFDLERIAARSSTENVARPHGQRDPAARPAARTAMELAAAIGDRFDVATLAAGRRPVAGGGVAGISPTRSRRVWSCRSTTGCSAATAGLTLKFLHDGVRQAAYARIAPAERRDVHCRLGRLLLDATRARAGSESASSRS